MFMKYASALCAAVLAVMLAAPAADARTLREGNRGEDVKTLQRGLNVNGASLKVDGIYGRGTVAAVKNYQRKIGLKPVDGIAGKKTLASFAG